MKSAFTGCGLRLALLCLAGTAPVGCAIDAERSLIVGLAETIPLQEGASAEVGPFQVSVASWTQCPDLRVEFATGADGFVGVIGVVDLDGEDLVRAHFRERRAGSFALSARCPDGAAAARVVLRRVLVDPNGT